MVAAASKAFTIFKIVLFAKTSLLPSYKNASSNCTTRMDPDKTYPVNVVVEILFQTYYPKFNQSNCSIIQL